jgi:hypothetical protein
MSRTIIQVEGLGKRYRIGQPRQHNALAHVIGDALRAPLRLFSGNSSVPTASSNGNERVRKNTNKNANGGSPYIWALDGPGCGLVEKKPTLPTRSIFMGKRNSAANAQSKKAVRFI